MLEAIKKMISQRKLSMDMLETIEKEKSVKMNVSMSGRFSLSSCPVSVRRDAASRYGDWDRDEGSIEKKEKESESTRKREKEGNSRLSNGTK